MTRSKEDDSVDDDDGVVAENHPCVTMAEAVCRNGGVCTVNDDDYLCNCASGWSGRNCEVREGEYEVIIELL